MPQYLLQSTEVNSVQYAVYRKAVPEGLRQTRNFKLQEPILTCLSLVRSRHNLILLKFFRGIANELL